MSLLSTLLFGKVAFHSSEEYREFQFKFLCIVIIAGAVLTGLLLIGSHSAVNPIDPLHVRSMSIFTGGSLLLWWLLRGRKTWFPGVAWTYECLCMLEYASALYYVSEDEFRVVWFLTNIPGVYLLLGCRPGAFITALTAFGLALGNAYLPAPYSPNAMATLLASVIYLGVFFHLYARRAISFYLRMRESNQALYRLAMHDHLTGVLNAKAYYQVCDQLISLAARANTPYSVLFIDLDHFKVVNDTHGHAAGDTVLQAAARCIGNSIRTSDSLGRVGGEEFSVFLPNTGSEAAHGVAENIRRAIASLDIDVAGVGVLKITASIGVAGNKREILAMHEIQKQADQAMYLAKRAGRNRVACLGRETADSSESTPMAANTISS